MNTSNNPLSLGKRRGLSSCAGGDGIFTILALDHRQAIKDAFTRPELGGNPYAQSVDFKSEVVRCLAPYSTAVLLDPSLGAGPTVACEALPGNVGLVVALEETGYNANPTARLSRVAKGWSVAKIKRMGASAVKLLVYYHPASPTAAEMRTLVQRTADECQCYDIPLFLEPLSYSIDPARPKLSPQERREVVVQTARELTTLGADVLKAEFPVLVDQQPDEHIWQEACAELDAASCVPWVLLSAAVDFEVFVRQATIACRAGASGILAGRAIWKEALSMHGPARLEFLKTTAADRMQALRRVCQADARPYNRSLTPLPLTEDWYREYPE